ncbi:MAG: hypothetical protein OXG39_11275 [Chloroflexi bacterium]|nr:hypothetical protein [Chloroflexota bacterium]
MRKLLIILVICIALLVLAPSAFACSGVGQPFENIVNYDAIVAATVMDVDDVGISAVVKVDRYFKGAGDEYLAIMQHPPALQHAGHIRRYDTGCTYAARRPRTWRKNDYGYLGLSANNDGTYSRGWFYSPQDGSVEFHSDDEGEYQGRVSLPVNEFELYLLKLGGQSETIEPLSNPYPLMRFLNITTESGERYRLNPDRSVTWLDPVEYPIAISNDGSHVIFQLDDGVLGFQYLALTKKPLVPGPDPLRTRAPADGRFHLDDPYTAHGWLHPVTGFFGTFSPDSSYVAVQEASRLVVYSFYPLSIKGAAVGFANNMAMREIASIDLTWLSADQLPLVWSADRRTIAFQNAQGIWLWKVFRDAAPQLLIPAEAAQKLLDLSAFGRYLRFGNDAGWTLLDVQTGESWTDTLITPDESRLIQIRAELAEEDARQAGVVERYERCHESLSRCPLVIRAAKPKFIFWFDPGFVGQVSSTGVEIYPWKLSLERLICRCCCGGIFGAELPSIDAFAFDSLFLQPAFAFEKTKINFALQAADNYDGNLDLGQYLDSPIVGLDWGQPIFFIAQPNFEVLLAAG